MRKLLFTTALLTSLTIAATAKNQNISLNGDFISLPFKGNRVVVKDETSKLTASKNFFISLFTEAGIEKTTFYNLQKQVIATTYKVTKEQLPNAVLKSLNKKYSDYSVKEIVVYEDNQPASDLYSTMSSNSGDLMYFIHLKNETKELIVRITPTGAVYFFKEL